MNKFRYKFDSVRKVKEIQEKKVQKEIALIELEVDNLHKILKMIFEEKSKVKEEVSKKKNVKVSELKFYDQEEQLLEMKAQNVLNDINQFESKKKIKIAELEQKNKEHKILDILEEKHYENFMIEQNQLEQKEIDEIATKKFVRG